jgi:DNA-directed RNA polymerase subunit RPC12/RpoP
MKNERTEDDDHHFATCTYCGTQTALSAKRLDSDKPVKCPKCGAPLKVVPPRAKGRGEPQLKTKRDYGYDFTHPPWNDGIIDKLSRDEALSQLIGFVIVLVCISVLFLVTLISKC